MPFASNSVQDRHAVEVQSVQIAEHVIARWRLDKLDSARPFDCTSDAAQHYQFTLTNLGDSTITLKFQDSNGSSGLVSDDNPFTEEQNPPTDFENSFSDVAAPCGSPIVLAPRVTKIPDLYLDPNIQRFLQIVGSASPLGALLRIQITASSAIDLIDVQRKAGG